MRTEACALRLAKPALRVVQPGLSFSLVVWSMRLVVYVSRVLLTYVLTQGAYRCQSLGKAIA